MKKLIAFLLLLTIVVLVAMPACNKEPEENHEPNLPPVAFAGNDTTIKITVCDLAATARLDGHLSYDPGSVNLLRFLWKQVSGPARAFDGVDSTWEIVTIINLVIGEYKFVLEVFDSKGLSTTDSIIVKINDFTDYKDQELDIVGVFGFGDNIVDFSGNYHDEFNVNGNLRIANESFPYKFFEYSDSTVINSQFTNFFSLYDAGAPTKWISGVCSVDFESIYLKGGGAFDGTIKLDDGSAYFGCENMEDFPPIQIAGNLNAAAKTITMKLKGRIVL